MGYMKTIAGKEVQVRKVLWQSTNKLLGSKGYLGGKTGQTNNAGNCLASLFKDEDNKQYIIIVLGCLTRELRFE